MHSETTEYIGLGSNLADASCSAEQHIQTAISQLDELEQCRVVACSSLYLSAPMGPQDQDDYFNAVAEVETGLSAMRLLDALQDIENRHGRERNQHWGPRTLDLDILLYGDTEIDDDRLTVPHAGLCEREFVLYPLFEIAPQLVIPARGKLSEIVKQCPERGLKQVGDIA